MASIKEINVQGHKIAAAEFNEKKDGLPVFFIHGITASINFWEPLQVPIVKEKCHWYALSLPGHYPAALPAAFEKENLTADAVGKVLMEAVKKLVGDQPVILAGHSTGGFAALQMAARFPENIAGVISIAGFAHCKLKGTIGLLQKIARTAVIGRTMFKNNIRVLAASRKIYHIAAGFYAYKRKNLYSFPKFESVLDIVHRDTKNLDPESLFKYFSRMPDIDISDALSKITAPALIITGDYDPIVPLEQQHLMSDRIAESKIHVIKECGHLPMFEKPDEYNQIITDWILTFV